MPSDIQRPTLLLDPARARRNIERMAEKAKRAGVRFRPHFKTHQSAAVGEWFRPYGVQAITVSSVEMAEYFAGHGWSDITVAFPANIHEIAAIDRLARRIRLGLLVESEETVRALAAGLTAAVDVWIKIDVGSGRTGIPWTRAAEAAGLGLIIREAARLNLRGLLTHAGHSYKAASRPAIKAVHRDQMEHLRVVREAMAAAGLGPLEISIGDTPTCSVVDDLSGADEIRPGNFVFFDLVQLGLGVCREEDIAVALACPVVAKHEDGRKIVIYGGAIHFSKDSLPGPAGPIFGRVVRLDEHGWSPLPGTSAVISLSQEHGLIAADEETFRQTRVGDLLAVLPVHSCLTVRAMRAYRALAGESISVL
jgi:D-serine deaminase-like pyridoxal phosphate-dependent protein